MEVTSSAGCCACATSRSRAAAGPRSSPPRLAPSRATHPVARAPTSVPHPAVRAPALLAFCVGSRHLYVAEHTHLTRRHTRGERGGVGAWVRAAFAASHPAACVATRRDVARAASRRDLARAASRRRRVPSARDLCGFASFVCGRARTFDAETHTRRKRGRCDEGWWAATRRHTRGERGGASRRRRGGGVGAWVRSRCAPGTSA